MLITSLSSPPSSFPEVNNVQGLVRLLPYSFSGAGYFYTGKERMNKRPYQKKIFFFKIKTPTALSQTIPPLTPTVPNCVPSFHVQTSCPQINPLGAQLPVGTCAAALVRPQPRRPRAAASQAPRAGPDRPGAPGEASLQRGWSLRPAALPPAFSRSN